VAAGRAVRYAPTTCAYRHSPIRQEPGKETYESEFCSCLHVGPCFARADVYYDFETAATTPVWLGTTQMVQNTSASHQGTNALAFTGTYPDAYLLTELPRHNEC